MDDSHPLAATYLMQTVTEEPSIGRRVEAVGQCLQCQQAFQYLQVNGRKKVLCPGCAKGNGVNLRRRLGQRLRLAPEEARGRTMRGVYAYAVRQMDEVAAILGCSKQNVQQAERSAFWQIRRWKRAMEQGLDGTKEKSNQPPCPTLQEFERALRNWSDAHKLLRAEEDCFPEAAELFEAMNEFRELLKKAMTPP
jgi:hypothetical protein